MTTKTTEWVDQPQVGDILGDTDGGRDLVMAIETHSLCPRHSKRSCDRCWGDESKETEVTVWVAHDEPVEVLTPGGGITKVVGLTEWWGDPTTTRVLRCDHALG